MTIQTAAAFKILKRLNELQAEFKSRIDNAKFASPDSVYEMGMLLNDLGEILGGNG